MDEIQEKIAILISFIIIISISIVGSVVILIMYILLENWLDRQELFEYGVNKDILAYIIISIILGVFLFFVSKIYSNMKKIENKRFLEKYVKISVSLHFSGPLVVGVVSYFAVKYVFFRIDDYSLVKYSDRIENLAFFSGLSFVILFILLSYMFPVLLYRRLGRQLK